MRVQPWTIPTGDLIELARTLPAIVATPPPHQLSFANIKDQLAKADAKRWSATLPTPDEPHERRVWTLDKETYAAFAEAWRARHQPASQAVAGIVGACTLIADHAQYPLAERDLQVAAVLTDWLARRTQPTQPAPGSDRP